MSTAAILQAVAFVAVIALLTRPLGAYLFRVYEGTPPFRATLGRLERVCHRLSGVDPSAEQG